jgi:hypothetical protein
MANRHEPDTLPDRTERGLLPFVESFEMRTLLGAFLGGEHLADVERPRLREQERAERRRARGSWSR